MSAPESRPSRELDSHWTDEITKAKDLEVTYKDTVRIQATAILAVALLTFATLAVCAWCNAPLYAYLVVSGVGVFFGLLVRRKRWRKRKKYG